MDEKLSTTGNSLYVTLNLAKTANAEDIKRAYRTLALKYHPDKNAGDPKAEEKFKEINEAYKILSDPRTRRIYDQYGSLGLEVSKVFGEENVKLYFFLTSRCCRIFITGCCLLTCCCFCFCCFCCCNFCFGKFKPNANKDEEQSNNTNVRNDGADQNVGKHEKNNSEDDVVVNQPSFTNSTSGGTTQHTNVFVFTMPSTPSPNDNTELSSDDTD